MIQVSQEIQDAVSAKRLRLATVFTILAVIVLLGLGTWQVVRLQYKRALIDKINERVSTPPVLLPLYEPLDLEEWLYRRVIIRGEYLHDHEVHLYTGPQSYRGEIGYNLLTPMRLTPDKVVLVDRGWVPADKKNQSDRLETLVAGGGVVEVGMIHPPEEPGTFTPDNDLPNNMWFWIDIPQILQSVTRDKSADHYYIRALESADDASLPVKGKPVVVYRNDHLQYAITWYSLAVILIIVYGAFRRENSLKAPH